jgi:hypothetical protein
MSVLKKKVHQVVPMWVILVVCVGSAAGAFLWISNTISTQVEVHENPILLEGAFETSAYLNVTSQATFLYTIQDPGRCSGYIYLRFISMGVTLNPNSISVYITVTPEGQGYSTPSLFSADFTSSAITLVYGDDFLSAIDFSDGGMVTGGQINISIIYHVVGWLIASLAITESSS